MPRARRKFGTKGLNHCIMRGINKKDIFFDDQDRKKYLKLLKQNKEKYKIKLGTYVLMQNHVHLIIKGYDKNEEVALEKWKIQHNLELDKYENEYDNYYTEFELIYRLSDELVKKIIDKKSLKYINQSNEKINDILLHIVIKEVIDIKGVSINQLSRVTGISRRMLNKISENKLR